MKLRFIGKYTKFTDLDSGVNYPQNQAIDTSYTRNFTSAASGASGFESTIKLSSKANEDDMDQIFNGDSGPVGF